MAGNLISYSSPEAARRADRAVNSLVTNGGRFGGVREQRREYVNTKANTGITDIAIITERPPLGYGQAKCRKATITDTGDVFPYGDEFVVIIPKLGVHNE